MFAAHFTEARSPSTGSNMPFKCTHKWIDIDNNVFPCAKQFEDERKYTRHLERKHACPAVFGGVCDKRPTPTPKFAKKFNGATQSKKLRQPLMASDSSSWLPSNPPASESEPGFYSDSSYPQPLPFAQPQPQFPRGDETPQSGVIDAETAAEIERNWALVSAWFPEPSVDDFVPHAQSLTPLPFDTPVAQDFSSAALRMTPADYMPPFMVPPPFASMNNSMMPLYEPYSNVVAVPVMGHGGSSAFSHCYCA
ncbi:hypothetical protein C8Q74DRAFT_286385 [Fomes fomentarius]|nr:hypothetical protein C8Q74DRAFT_286385 [Fomes fomentarius]